VAGFFICPNCHSQTDTYSGKNANRENNTKYNRVLSKKWIANHPSKETLCSVFKEVGSFRGVGKLYGVSDKTIAKWFKHYELPTTKEKLKKFLEM